LTPPVTPPAATAPPPEQPATPGPIIAMIPVAERAASPGPGYARRPCLGCEAPCWIGPKSLLLAPPGTPCYCVGCARRIAGPQFAARLCAIIP
jgi:hypothetical protein